jgi:sugar phosphate isomerase/epimerase
MKIGLNTDSLGHLSLTELLPVVAEAGIECLEFGSGNWSKAPHLNLAELLESAAARRELLARLADHGVEISALNCSGNPLKPGADGKRHDEVTRQVMELARLLDLNRVVMMSGLPGGLGDRNPNWITSVWPPDNLEILKWQWQEVAIPYWRDLAVYARNLGIARIALECHGAQLVHNAETLLRLRAAAGDNIGANLDPSHLFWMGADPLAALRALGAAIFHVHAKDTRLEALSAATDGLLETRANDRIAERAWNFATLGYGHDEGWWAAFVAGLRMVGYDDVLSIEHEDYLIDSLEGVRKAAGLLQRVLMRAPPSYANPAV